MNRILYAIAILFFIGWVVGFFAFNLGMLIHILLVVAVIAILLRIIKGY
jgi:Family of unknown function (DUF5670)